MARTTRSPKHAPTAPVTPERAGRLCKLLRLLARKPQTRNGLARSLKIGVRGFYRDLEALRLANIEVQYQDGRYSLASKLEGAVARLPFPDPGLTLGEAMQLARGRSNAHRRLKKLVLQVTKS
jgi:predicted DNA-binding transcriptional regulator YafY